MLVKSKTIVNVTQQLKRLFHHLITKVCIQADVITSYVYTKKSKCFVPAQNLILKYINIKQQNLGTSKLLGTVIVCLGAIIVLLPASITETIGEMASKCQKKVSLFIYTFRKSYYTLI